jgi:hypothetical protein
LSISAILLVALLAIELPVVGAALSKRPQLSSAARALVFALPLVLALSVRAARAFSTHDVLDWDETYYVSLAVTGAGGHGLYPYIFGFGPMHIMGGIGYAAYAYALAVHVFGPTVFALRTVSLLVSVLGVAGIWMLAKVWYGSGTAWIAAALTASFELFVLSNSARMDSWTFAFVAWALVIVALAFAKPRGWRWHLVAGLVFGLGLQVHIDTAITAAACGLLYLLRYAGDARRARRVWLNGHPLFMFVAGVMIGGAIYAAANIVPNPAAYYIMTVRVRLDATSSYSGGTSSLLGSFLAPRLLLAKEVARYRQLVSICPPIETALVLIGIAAMIARRNRADRILSTLVPAVVVGAAILLNNASPLYYIHVLPVLIIPAAALFTHGISGQSTVSLRGMTAVALAASALAICAVCAGSSGKTLETMRAQRNPTTLAVGAVQRTRALIDRRCRMAADAALYVPYFADYPYVISLRATEVHLAMLYYGTTDEAAYWWIKQPDVVLATIAPSPGLARYIERRGLLNVAPELWMNPAGCSPGP